MAGETETEEEQEEQKAAPKKSKAKLIIIIFVSILILALLAIGGFIVYKQVSGDGGKSSDKKTAEETTAEDEGAMIGVVTPLDPFIVNLSDTAGKRYLKITIQLELSDELLNQELHNKMPQIKDSVITVLSSKTSDDVLTIEGKFKLKEQILARINKLLKTGVVKNVYFVEFVIQ